jgi:hypothetical protein
LATPTVPPNASVEGDMLGKIVALKFVDRDITDEKKFPEMEWDKYLCTKSVLGRGEILIEPHTWATGLEKSDTKSIGDSTLWT